jgi:hypothetical protein
VGKGGAGELDGALQRAVIGGVSAPRGAGAEEDKPGDPKGKKAEGNEYQQGGFHYFSLGVLASLVGAESALTSSGFC